VLVGIGLLMLLWLALAHRLTLPTAIAASVGAIAAWSAQRWLFPETPRVSLRLFSHPVRLLRFLLTLGSRFVQSTWYTCRLILLGREEGRIVALPNSLEDALGRVILSIAVTLTPSTISLLIEDDLHYIHWLGMRGRPGDWRQVKDPLEYRVKRLVERGSDAGR
jgi:multisubunit Na+/H+ antiporter MnhE subunit